VPDARRRRASGWVIAALSALGVLAVVALTAGLILANQPKKVVVPNVVGKPRAQAEAELRAQQLLFNSKVDFQTNCTKDSVIAQDPRDGEKVAPNTNVNLNICGGPATKTVPNVVGSTRDAADATLKGAGLVPKFEEVDSDKPAQQVIETNPKAGEKVAEGTEVVVKISKGNLKAIRDVRNKTEAAARALLEADGFVVTPVPEDTNDPDKVGLVVNQDPKPNTLKPVGSKVTIFVGRAKAPPTPTPTVTVTVTP
jgi:serine/threonine-protein kinase